MGDPGVIRVTLRLHEQIVGVRRSFACDAPGSGDIYIFIHSHTHTHTGTRTRTRACIHTYQTDRHACTHAYVSTSVSHVPT